MPPETGTIAPEVDTLTKVTVYDDSTRPSDDGDDNEIEEGVPASGGNSKFTASNLDDPTAHTQKTDYPPSLFTNDRGNLKIVSLVVRNPCLIFWLIIALCVLISFLLQVMVFRASGATGPFTVPSNEFDLGDIRSIQYDSYRLAKDEVAAQKKLMVKDDREVLKQSELAAIAYWVFEGENPEGVFGSKDAIEGMKDAFDVFLADPKFKDWCVLDYKTSPFGGGPPADVVDGGESGNGTETPAVASGNGTRRLSSSAQSSPTVGSAFPAFHRVPGRDERLSIPLNRLTRRVQADANTEDEELDCQPPLSPLTMYYASEWDNEKAAAIIAEFSDPAKVEKFNTLALCYIQGVYCELLSDVPDEDKLWALKLGASVSSMIQHWDMQGDLVANFNQVTELASHLLKVDVYKGAVDFGFDKGFSAENQISHFSRGIVFWGGPLESRNMTSGEAGEEADEEKEDTEGDLRKEFIKAEYLDEMDAQSEKDEHSSINSYYFMTSIIGDVILKIVTQDAMLAIFSFAFVFIWLRVNTRSWFLAFVGFFEIFFSIPIAWWIFTVVFRIKYFATLNSLALFVVAAIGADDIFIFMDAYKQSQYHPELLGDLETRMSWVYRRTGTAMGITSATTCAAFLCTLITPLPSLQSFGIFAAVVIFIDYVLVMSLFCTAVVIYHNRYENTAKFGCCCPCGTIAPSNTEQALTTLQEHEGEMKRDRVSEFFKIKVAGFIKAPRNRAGLGVLFSVWIGIAIWQATLLEATKEIEQVLSENHPLQKSITILNQEFPTADDDLGLKVYYVWGLGGVNRDGVNRLIEPENYGSPTFEPGFDFNEQCQADLLSFCDKLRIDPEYSDLIKQKDGLGQVYCFIEELAAYNVKGDLDDCEYVRQRGWKDGDADVSWTVPPSQISTIMPEFLKQKTCYDEDGRETISGRYQSEIGWNGISLKYAGVSAESAVLDPFGQNSQQVTQNEYDQFIKIAEEQAKIISGSCNSKVVMTDLDEKFVFMNNQSIYVQSAIQSSILGVAIAFFVLLISTRVLHIAFFASLSITSVLISVVGTMVMLGWNLGSIESTLIGIIAGFSVDYVVHLAHAYEIAEGDTYARVTEAFSDLGISVFNGMITSVVASLPLFFCQLQFFAKFGTFLCLTIVFSWVFANFGFMSVLAQLKIPLKKDKCFSL